MNAETLLAVFLAEARERSLWTWGADEASELAAVHLIDAAPDPARARLCLLAAEALAVPEDGGGRYDTAWGPALGFVVKHVLGAAPPFTAEQLEALASSAGRWPAWDWLDTPPYDAVLDVIAGAVHGAAPPSGLASALRALRVRLAVEGAWDEAQQRRFARIDHILAARGPGGAWFDASDAWGEAANAWIARQGASEQQAWAELLTHAATAVRSAPSTRWRAQAVALAERVGLERLADALHTWFAHVPVGLTRAQAEHRQTLAVRYQTASKPRPAALGEANRTRVRGLCWTAGSVRAEASVEAVLVEAMAVLAERGYRSIPGVGAGDLRLANAAVRGLSTRSPALAEPPLRGLLDKVTHAGARRVIVSALERLSSP